MRNGIKTVCENAKGGNGMRLFCVKDDYRMENVGRFRILVDTETGVNYIYSGQGALCPRYTPEGKLIVSSQQEISRLIESSDNQERYI